MIEPKFITKDDATNLSLDYEALRALGISYIEKFSGNQWTDYNYHDPGITFLEQLCYAITDLGYRTNFPISDILLSKVDTFDLAENNLLHGPDKVFPTTALTKEDYRKIILDSLLTVRNVWVNTINNHPLGIDGLVELQVQLDDEITAAQEKEVIKQLKEVFLENRSLGTDLEKITLLSKDELSISGKLFIDSFIVGEDVLAAVYHKLERYLNNEYLEESQSPVSKIDITADLYMGPKLTNNGLKQLKLKDKTNEIYTSELIELIENVPGVTGMEDIVIYKNGVKCFENIISFEKDRYPSMAHLDQDINTSSYTLKLYRNNNLYEIDTAIFNQLFEALTIEQTTTFQELRTIFQGVPRGRFSLKEIETYYSIQRELPAVYGLREKELPTNSTRKRVAQAKQLKAYLLLFEQTMANHLSQLANIRKLYSIHDEDMETYYSQTPVDVPNLNDVIDVNSHEAYHSYLKKISTTAGHDLKRKNQILDHLIARFGESYDTTLLTKLNRIGSIKKTELTSLRAKMNYAKQLVKLGQERNKGANYSAQEKNNKQQSGLQERLELLLNISKKEQHSITSPLFEKALLDDVKKKWVNKNIETDNNKKLRILCIDDDNYSSEDFEFYCANYEELKDLFINGIKDTNYQIYETENIYSLIFNRSGKQNPTKIYHSDSFQKCVEKKERAINQFSSLNDDCEGFYFIDNILLRPHFIDQYQLEIVKNKVPIFKSLLNASLESQEELRNDIVNLCRGSSNYSIIKNDDLNYFQLVIYDSSNSAKVRSVATYETKEAANEAIDDHCSYFNLKSKDRANKKLKITISKAKSASHHFPEGFNYSNHISIICPDWPLRFQNKEFKNYISDVLDQYIPAHLTYTTHYLSINEMKQFENVHQSWIKNQNTASKEEKEEYSLHLIQLLSSYK